MTRRLRPLILAVLAAACAGLAGCGQTVVGRNIANLADVSLVLDFTPNAVHTGIYTAIGRGYTRAAGVTLHVIIPSQSTDAIRLLQTGRVDFAILDIHDLAIAREQGLPIVGILPIVEQPLASVIAAPRIASPRQLQGQTVGITGDPSDTAVLDSVVRGAGGDPAKVKTITIGYDAVSDLLAGRVAAATAFWNDEGVTVSQRRPGFHVYRVQDFGAPSYPELVLCTTAALVRRHPAVARELVSAIVRGYQSTVANPTAAEQDLEQQVPGLVKAQVAAQLTQLLPACTGADGHVGQLDLPLLRVWARWERRFGIVTRIPNVATMFDPAFAPR